MAHILDTLIEKNPNENDVETHRFIEQHKKWINKQEQCHPGSKMENIFHVLLVCEVDLPDSELIWDASCRAQKEDFSDIWYDLPWMTQSLHFDHKELNGGVF